MDLSFCQSTDHQMDPFYWSSLVCYSTRSEPDSITSSDLCFTKMCVIKLTVMIANIKASMWIAKLPPLFTAEFRGLYASDVQSQVKCFWYSYASEVSSNASEVCMLLMCKVKSKASDMQSTIARIRTHGTFLNLTKFRIFEIFFSGHYPAYYSAHNVVVVSLYILKTNIFTSSSLLTIYKTRWLEYMLFIKHVGWNTCYL